MSQKSMKNSFLSLLFVACVFLACFRVFLTLLGRFLSILGRAEPFGYVKHRSKCTFPISDIFAILADFCSISSRFLTILTSFLVPKSPKIAKKRSKKEVEKREAKKRDKRAPGGPQPSLNHERGGTCWAPGLPTTL